MLSKRLIRWSGPVTVFAGLLYGIGALLHPVGESLTAYADPMWVPSHQIYWVSAVLMTLGLVGIFAYLVERSGWLLLIGFILAFVGSLLVGSIVLVSATVFPIIAENAPEIFEQAATFPPYLLLVFLGFVVGYILLGIEIIRGDMLPKWSGLLLIVGVILFFVSEMGFFEQQLSHLFVTVGDVMFGVGLISIGYSVWKNTASTA